MQRIRVLILSDDPLVRAGLSTILGEDESLDVVGMAALAQCDEALLDAYLPDAILIELDQADPTLYSKLDEWAIPHIKLLDRRQGNIVGRNDSNTLPRQAGLPLLSAALHAVAIGLSVSDQAVVSPDPGMSELSYPVEALTGRESEVLQLVGQGMTNRAIGQVLSIKESTVKYHVAAIFDKLGAQSRTEAVAIASKIGLITF